MNLGFIGTGALTSAIVAGLKSLVNESVSIVVSPRNQENAAALATRYPDVRIAADNQAVLDACGTIMLAVRPQVAPDVLSVLRFRHDHKIISLIATLSREDIAALVAPVEHVTKALPMPMIAQRLGATIITPHDPIVAGLFGKLGKVIETNDTAEFDALSVVTATYATYFKYLDAIHHWLKAQGVADEKGRDYIATLYQALASAPGASPSASFTHLSAEYATRGGINEQVARELTERGVFDALTASLEAIHRRVTGAKAG